MYYQVEIRYRGVELFIDNPKEIYDRYKKKLEEHFKVISRAYRKTDHSGITYEIIFKMIPNRIIREKEAKEIFKSIFDEKKYVVDIYSLKEIR